MIDRDRAQHRAAAQRRRRRRDDVPGADQLLADQEQTVARVLLRVAGRGDRALLTFAHQIDLEDHQHQQHADDDADHDLDEADAASAFDSRLVWRTRSCVLSDLSGHQDLMPLRLAGQLPEDRDDDAAALRRKARLRQIDRRRIGAGRGRKQARRLRLPGGQLRAARSELRIESRPVASSTCRRPSRWPDWWLRRDSARRWSRGWIPPSMPIRPRTPNAKMRIAIRPPADSFRVAGRWKRFVPGDGSVHFSRPSRRVARAT